MALLLRRQERLQGLIHGKDLAGVVLKVVEGKQPVLLLKSRQVVVNLCFKSLHRLELQRLSGGPEDEFARSYCR